MNILPIFLFPLVGIKTTYWKQLLFQLKSLLFFLKKKKLLLLKY